jgi:hypothetical protein
MPTLQQIGLAIAGGKVTSLIISVPEELMLRRVR